MSNESELSRSTDAASKMLKTDNSSSSGINESASDQAPEIVAGRLTTYTRTLHVGPLPPPEVLSAYGEVDPSFPERILKMAEAQAEHRKQQEREDLCADIDDLKAQRGTERIGQVFALVVCLAFLGGGVWVTLRGHDWVGGVIVGATLLGIVTVFITGRRSRINPPSTEAHHQ